MPVVVPLGLGAIAVLAAAANWVARGTDTKWLEYLTKPTVPLALAGVAATLEPADDAQRWCFVAGLVACAAGDTLLMLPVERFVAGLAAFLAGHVAFLVGFAQHPASMPGVGVAIVGLVVAVAGQRSLGRVLRAALARSRPLGSAVALYVVAIVAMALAAGRSGGPFGWVGAGAFVASDTVLAHNRFVAPVREAPVMIMVSYHLALGALTAALR